MVKNIGTPLGGVATCSSQSPRSRHIHGDPGSAPAPRGGRSRLRRIVFQLDPPLCRAAISQPTHAHQTDDADAEQRTLATLGRCQYTHGDAVRSQPVRSTTRCLLFTLAESFGRAAILTTPGGGATAHSVAPQSAGPNSSRRFVQLKWEHGCSPFSCRAIANHSPVD